jgi:hypothetical protein
MILKSYGTQMEVGSQVWTGTIIHQNLLFDSIWSRLFWDRNCLAIAMTSEYLRVCKYLPLCPKVNALRWLWSLFHLSGFYSQLAYLLPTLYLSLCRLHHHLVTSFNKIFSELALSSVFSTFIVSCTFRKCIFQLNSSCSRNWHLVDTETHSKLSGAITDPHWSKSCTNSNRRQFFGHFHLCPDTRISHDTSRPVYRPEQPTSTLWTSRLGCLERSRLKYWRSSLRHRSASFSSKQ